MASTTTGNAAWNWTRATAWIAAASVGAGLLTACAGQTRGSGASATPASDASAAGPGSVTAAGSSAAAAVPDAAAIARIRERAIGVVEESSRHADGQVRGYASEAASIVPRRLGEVIVRLLEDPAPGVRAMAAISAGRASLRDAQPRLQALLTDESPFVRAGAIYGLSKSGAAVDPSPLGAMLVDDSMAIRSQAAWVLGELGNRSALAMLRAAAVEGVSRARPVEVTLFQLQVAEARVKLGDNEPLEGIRAALYPARPEDLEAAVLAVQILGEVKDRGAMDQLIYLTQYRDPRGNAMPVEFRLAVAIALAKMGLDRGAFLADEVWQDPSEPVRVQAATVYGYTARAQQLARLDAMLSDPSPMVRVAAAGAILRSQSRAGR